MNYHLISVITVAKDAEQTIKEAIESVIVQTYRDIEYIFVVGNSSDNTNAIIDSYKDKLKRRNIIYKHVSESDAGIYNAMNKGIKLASGEWVYFLNSDDKLCDKYVLEKIFNNKHIMLDNTDCIYGNIVLVDGERRVVRKGAPIETIYYKFPFSHQAVFVKRLTVNDYMFDENYSRLADFNQFLRMYLDKKKFVYVDIEVAFFALSGVSQKNIYSLMIERENIHKSLGVARKRRAMRWIRYFFICIIKGNGSLYSKFISGNEKMQRLKERIRQI